MESIKNQTYKNIITIVHSDDPRDDYVEADIIVRGPVFDKSFGNGSYNLYNNRLLKVIPEIPGWYHFIDDDDEYFDKFSIEKFVNNSKPECINVCKVIRWNNQIFPKDWLKQRSYQTECFLLHTQHKLKAQWWGNLGGDHDYSKKLTRILPINWIEDLIICKAQEGKGRGQRLDAGGKFKNNSSAFSTDNKISVLALQPYKRGLKKDWLRQGHISRIPFDYAIDLEKIGVVKITYPDISIENKIKI
jgi:hypothetical protein